MGLKALGSIDPRIEAMGLKALGSIDPRIEAMGLKALGSIDPRSEAMGLGPTFPQAKTSQQCSNRGQGLH